MTVDLILHELLAKLIEQVDRLATAIEKQNAERMRCPNCRGDGKGYDGHRCMKCGGTGMRNPP